MRSVVEFGEQVDGYDVRGLNERAVHASAGLLFFFAMQGARFCQSDVA